MCIACEMALLMALDELSDTPPPGFPGACADDAARFACDVPEQKLPTDAPPTADERKP